MKDHELYEETARKWVAEYARRDVVTEKEELVDAKSRGEH